MELSEKIRRAREMAAKGISQEALAVEFNVPETEISDWLKYSSTDKAIEVETFVARLHESDEMAKSNELVEQNQAHVIAENPLIQRSLALQRINFALQNCYHIMVSGKNSERISAINSMRQLLQFQAELLGFDGVRKVDIGGLGYYIDGVDLSKLD